MKNWHKIFLFTVMAAISIGLTACGADSNGVPSLGATPDKTGGDETIDIEAKMMEFTECLRDEGLEVMDPVVDSDGNVDKPEFAPGFEVSKEKLGAAYVVCEEIIMGITFGKKENDQSDQIDYFLDLAACLREEGYDVDDPTAENPYTFKTAIDWDDPSAVEAYETCSGDEGNTGEGKKP